MNIPCSACTQMCINNTQDHYQQQKDDQSQFTVAMQRFFYKLIHFIAWCATLHVCARVWATNRINTHSQQGLLKGKAALTVKVTARSYDFTGHTMLASASKHSAKVKISLGARSIATAGKENQSSHFNCICLLVINLLVQKDRWGKRCINTNLAGLHWNY